MRFSASARSASDTAPIATPSLATTATALICLAASRSTMVLKSVSGETVYGSFVITLATVGLCIGNLL
jgi:hypothetical protein